MVVKTLLDGMRFKGQVSLRRKGNDWFEYLAGGSPSSVVKRCGYYTVLSSCIIDGNLVIYVE